ncbi:hypothetical protein [Deinococcus radiotolerans]|uniref:Uncharacterized protein n=1 Tax=Deinococcus radiotolerans TaxID=1309407 RepID=A0ABQ2FQ34_9DEIO|nr:hypothetical protein [Deinococcus radiotolerans]GGL15775.1 hypothetical protein GCM10010844_38380 [Deinococcus radiotolerans]
MTLIAAVIEDGKVHMLGDTFTGFNHVKGRDTREKVWQAGDKVLGGAGNVRSILAFRYGFEFPLVPEGQSDDAYMRFTFPAALREFLKEHVHVAITNDSEDGNLALLIGWRGRIWCMADDFSITEEVCGWNAIGSGCEVALGALWVTRDLPAGRRLQAAGFAAEEYVSSVRGPFTVVVEP